MAEATSNQKLLEGLYTLGYPMSLLQQYAGRTDLPPDTFKQSLEIAGVNPADWGKVQGLLDFRKGDRPTRTALYEMMAIMGVSDVTAHNVQYAGDDPKKLLQVLNQELGPERAGALMIKATGGSPPSGTVWNPFRGEDPPKGTDTRWGQHLGVPGAAQPTEMQGQANTVVRGQDTGLPVGPTQAQAKAMATAAPKPTATGPSKPLGGPPAGVPTPDLGKATPDYSKMNDAELERELRKTFGKNVWVLNIPEIKKVVFDEMRNPSGVTQDVITSAIQATPWWQHNGQFVADYLQKQATDPESLRENVEGRRRRINTLATGYSMTLSPEKLDELANESEKWQWTDDDINAALAGEFDTNEGDHNAFIDSMRTDAHKYLVPLSEGTIDSWGKRIIQGGEAEKGNWTQFLKEQAVAMFPGLRDRLMTGTETVMDIAKPYATTAAQYLEMDENSIDFMQPQWMAALDQVDDKGVHSSMSPADWIRKIKTDAVYKYDYTEQAKQQATGFATDLLKKFGAI